MRLVVPQRVEPRVAQPEVGGQVDHVSDPPEQVRNEGLGGAVGQAQEHDVAAVHDRGVGLCVGEVRVLGGQAGVKVGDSRSGLGVAGRHHDLEVGMAGAEPQQFGPRESGGPDDADAGHPKIIQISA